MTVRSFRRQGDPILKQVAAEVVDFGQELQALAADMVDTARKGEPGLKALGLAAPQIGVGLRVILVGLDLYVNPVVIRREGLSLMQESCFSEPGKRLPVKRSKRVWVEYQDLEGNPRSIKAQGTTAHIFQHEIDHLDGVLMSERARMSATAGLTA